MAQSDSERNNSILREMERGSLDKIRIYNPTDKDFNIVWNKFKHVVPNKNTDTGYGKGMKVVERYLAKWYLKHMTDHMINEASDRKLEEIKSRYEKAGVEDVLLKANLDLERNKAMRTDNEDEVKRIANIIWLGIEERYGMDEITSESQSVDSKSVYEKVEEELNNKVYRKSEDESVSKPTEIKYPINNAKKKLVEEVSQ